MNYDILEALGQITKDKNLDLNYVIETLESGLLQAAKKKLGGAENVAVKLDRKTGEIKMFLIKKVVKKVEDPKIEISRDEAQEIAEEAEIGGEVQIPLHFEDFGRNAIAMAKQILIQRIQEAARDKVFEEYKDRVGEIVSGAVQQVDKGNIIVNLGKAEGFMPAKEQIPNEKFRQGNRIRAYILTVEKSSKGPQIILSRTHPAFLRRLFELEVPEIFEKIIEIKGVAREPGERAKVAVTSVDSRIDPVGACVGIRGSRVQGIVRELNNERIDVIQWSADPETFVSQSLAPAKIIHIDTNSQDKTMDVVVGDDKLSLAIGKAGQNARLASKLTGWKINILSETDYKQNKKKKQEEEETAVSELSQLSGVGEKLAEKIKEAGYNSLADLAETTVEDLTQIEGIGEKKAAKLIEQAKASQEEAQTAKKVEEE
ncbi:MAG: Transcription elongation protein nusA [candidate division Zixibacteria bacterium RBG-1]|nr:MAG: Transcription elongation protein nusA [candidate division Zixibacteria bacterium RBG-1]